MAEVEAVEAKVVARAPEDIAWSTSSVLQAAVDLQGSASISTNQNSSGGSLR